MGHPLLKLPRPILAGLANVYSFVIRLRLALYRTGYLKSKRLQATTISVGNITVGGTGKTPLVEYLARYLMRQGHSVAILTRGYGRQHPRRRQVVSDGQRILDDAELAGDEPLLLATHLPGVKVIADPDRYAAGAWAETTFGVDVHILDDAFQYLELERDVNLLVVDALDAFGGEQPLPLGRLREPLTEMARADAFIVTRADRPFDHTELEAKLDALAGEKPIFYAYHDLTGLLHPLTHTTVPAQRLMDRPVALVCAIARPDRFVDDVTHFRARITFQRFFPDHHRFSPQDIGEVFAQARAAGADWILTTEKDWMRLKRLTIPPEPWLWIVQSSLKFVDEARFLSFLVRAINAAMRP